MQQMQRREALDDASDAAGVEAVAEEVSSDRRTRLARLADLLDVQGALAPAAQEVRALMFIDRLLEDIDVRLQRYEDAL
jgi:molecular chaperone HscB